MNIGIFIHSQSGHTSEMGMAITKILRGKGHTVDIQLMKPVGNIHPRMKHVEFRDEIPDFSSYNAIIFGGPVWAFAPSPVVASFIKEIPDLKGKKAMCFTTSGFPTIFSGARGSLKKLKHQLEDIGADVLQGEPFFWGFIPNKKNMQKSVDSICERINKA
jgi:flavodoxin